MKVLGEQTNLVPDEVKTLMKCTHYSQHEDINKGTDLQVLVEEWPFFSQEIGMTVHLLELTRISLKETYLISVEKKGQRFLNHLCRQEQSSFAGHHRAENAEISWRAAQKMSRTWCSFLSPILMKKRRTSSIM